jgi:hypothetical protein
LKHRGQATGSPRTGDPHWRSCVASCTRRVTGHPASQAVLPGLRAHKKPIWGQPEIGAHFVSFNFPNSLICVVVSSVGRHRFAVEQPLLRGRMPESETSSRAFCWARPRRLQQDDWRSGHAINPSDSVVAMLVALIACSLVAIVVHTKVELPMLCVLRRLLIKRSDLSKLPVPRPGLRACFGATVRSPCLQIWSPNCHIKYI